MSAKYKSDIECYKTIYNGNISASPTQSCSHWRIGAQKDVLFAQKYLVKHVKSNKLIRFKLIRLFYELKENKAYLQDSPFSKDWEDLIENWYNNGADFYRKDCKGRPYTQKARELRALKNDLDE